MERKFKKIFFEDVDPSALDDNCRELVSGIVSELKEIRAEMQKTMEIVAE